MMVEPKVGGLMSWVSLKSTLCQVKVLKVTDDGRCYGRTKKYNNIDLVSKVRMKAHIPKEYLQ